MRLPIALAPSASLRYATGLAGRAASMLPFQGSYGGAG